MAVRFVLDSDVLIDLLAGREPAGTVVPNLLQMNLAGTTAVTVYELCSGAVRSSHRRRLDEFLSALPIFALDARAARYAGAVDLSLRQKGQLINPGDNMIAGICLAHNLALITRNVSHFRRVGDLKVITLQEIAG
jgi:predicted nucleic acid-binding protein